MRQQLSSPVESLQQLENTLQLLQQITDLQNVVDGMYLPVERLYTLLRFEEPCVF